MLISDLNLRESLDRAHATACAALLAERTGDGFWVGGLSSSALATATAVSALGLVRDGRPEWMDGQLVSSLVDRGVDWLAEHQNSDGGWGDSTLSLSNISTTMLVRAAFHLAGVAESHKLILERATTYIDNQGGAATVIARYGKDRTFAVPILANCALAGQANWRDVASLPFELAFLPQAWFRFMRLHVVSYALPALIAIGQLIHTKRPSRNLFARWLRNATQKATLRELESIQPASGGFLEAVPLTSFVTMSLAAIGKLDNPVVCRGVEFLIQSARSDGSWPIDSNLSVWLTTLTINSLVELPSGDATCLRSWLLEQQLKTVHPYTRAEPGGWGWSHLPGSVPDADDTSGAVLALANLPDSSDSYPAAARGIRWLLDLQNADGGWPTFCRGWGQLPFDRSGADLTAHALRACAQWRSQIELDWQAFQKTRDAGRCVFRLGIPLPRLDQAMADGLRFLQASQRSDGTWVPLWFGNQMVTNDENPVYGTARVLAAFRSLNRHGDPAAKRGVDWLVHSQNADGGWGGAGGIPSSVEETSLAIEVLAEPQFGPSALNSVRRGVKWLVERVESAAWRNPSPVGLYFAKLWYFEKLYPLVFAVAALGRVRRVNDLLSVPTSAHAS